nr:hypothetical protein [Tanacetum cinerariifolium]
MAARGQNHEKGKNKQAYDPKPKIPPPPKREDPTKDSICHECGEKGYWKRNCPQYLAELLKKKKNAALGAGGSDGFVNSFVNNTIQVFRNNMVSFSANPKDGTFKIDLSNSYTNESSIYVVRNKRVELDLDSTLLWHCRLRHISKKHIEKLQHDGLLDSFDLRAFEKYVSCMSGKMERKPYTYQVERAKDLLRLINIDVCGPFKIMSRQGASYFVTFTDDFSRYGYVYLLKHKHERRNRTLLDMVRSMRSQTTLTKSFWDYALETAVHILNMVPTKKVEKTPYEVHKDTHAPDRICLYIDVEEHELGDLSEPANYKAALLNPDSKKWLNAMNVEMQSMKDNEVWVLVELPPNGKTVGRKWLFKKKTDMDGVVQTYKARLVAKGYTQTPWIDYEETYSPIADIKAIRILIAIVAYYDYEIWQMDVKTAFLNGYLNEEVYMEQPKGFVNQKYPNWRYCMENSKRESIPMQAKLKLSKSQDASTPAELKRMQNVPYALAVGLIMYAVRCTLLDVAFAQNVTSQFQQNLGDLYWTTVKNILMVSCYIDAGYLTDADNLKSQTGYVFVLNGGVVDWKSAKQCIFATSSAVAEYIANFDASKEAVWVKKFIYGLGFVPTIKEPISMYCDNTRAIAIANESGITKGARHFRAKVHYLRKVIEYGDIKLEKVHTYDKLADPFTKALAFSKHSEHTRNIGMLPASSLISDPVGIERWFTYCQGVTIVGFELWLVDLYFSDTVAGYNRIRFSPYCFLLIFGSIPRVGLGDRFSEFVDQFFDRMNDMMNPRRREDRDGRRGEGEELEYSFFEGDGSSFDEWGDYGVADDDYKEAQVLDDDQYKDVIKEEEGFVDSYPNFQEDENNVSFSSVVLGVEEESMPDYDTDIEDVIDGEEDNMKDVVVVANDLCSLKIQTSVSANFSKIVDSNPQELILLKRGNFGRG